MAELVLAPAPALRVEEGRWCAGAALLWGAVSAVTVVLLGAVHPGVAAVTVIGGAVLLVSGSLLARTARGRQPARFLLLAGGLWPSVSWAVQGSGAGPFIAWNSIGVVWWLITCAAFRYPADVPRSRLAGRTLAAAFVLLVPVNSVQAAISPPEWNGFSAQAWWPAFVHSPGWFDLVLWTYAVGCTALGPVLAYALVRRAGEASGVDRVALMPVAVALGLLGTISGLAAAGNAVQGTTDAWSLTVVVQSCSMLILPCAQAISAVRSQMARASVATLLGSTRPDDPNAVQGVLRRMLQDDTLEVAYWSRSGGGYLDGSGRPLHHTPGRDRMAVRVAGTDGSPLALVVADGRLRHHPRLVDETVSAAGLVLENQRLHAELRARVDEVVAARGRLLTAQEEERRRLGRDLHDGAQVHLLALALQLEVLRVQAGGDTALAGRLETLKQQVRGSADEIRGLAEGLSSLVLREHGLGAAVASLGERVPLPLSLVIPECRLPPVVESAAYFVVSEAVSNAVRHAEADQLWITGRRDRDGYVVTVRDDGRGGTPIDGSALRSLRERVTDLGGAVEVRSNPGEGTTVSARLPLDPGEREVGAAGRPGAR